MRCITAAIAAALLLTFAGCGGVSNFTPGEGIVEGRDTANAKWLVYKDRVHPTVVGRGKAPNFALEALILEEKNTPYVKWFIYRVKVDAKGVGRVRSVMVEIIPPVGETQVIALNYLGDGLFVSEPTKVGPFFSDSVDEIREYEVWVTLVEKNGQKWRKPFTPVELRGICTQPPAPAEFR